MIPLEVLRLQIGQIRSQIQTVAEQVSHHRVARTVDAVDAGVAIGALGDCLARLYEATRRIGLPQLAAADRAEFAQAAGRA